MLSVIISSKGDNYREIINQKLIQMGGYTVATRGQRTASRETTKRSRIQTQILPPILNTERHYILIA
jgi:hypothetical protein